MQSSRKRQSISRGTCGTPANTKKFSVGLAGLPQTPKSFSRDLRGPRKHFEEVSGLCSVSAKALFPILVFAGLLQERFFPFWSLQRSCKGAFSHFGLCRTPARTLFPILAFAGLLQGRFSPFWSLQKSCKDAFPHFGVCRTSARALFLILAFAELLQGRFSSFWHLPHPPPPYFTDQRRPKGALVQGCRRNPSIFAHIL